ncbi:MAG: CopG family transcriptional regulator [Candidatus Latescibacteria bacterium]|nr:CopG family transcriptional regulator [Candidatus Latescibacterota bacterium]
MKQRKKTYEDAPDDIAEAIEEAEIITDFLPAPDQLILKEETVKVTLNLNRRSVEFFKKQAQKNGVPYQSMIRKVIDFYTEQYETKL